MVKHARSSGGLMCLRYPNTFVVWFSSMVPFLGSVFQFRCVNIAEVAELVYALDLGSSAERRESSSLSFRTIFGGWSQLAPNIICIIFEEDFDAG